MKRIFAYIGFSMAVSLIVINLVQIKYLLALTIGLAVIFAASLVLYRFRKALVVPICIGSALLCAVAFNINYYTNVSLQAPMDDKEAYCELYVVSAPSKTTNSQSYVAKTTVVGLNNAPQSIKINLYSNESLEPYRVYKGKVSFFKISNNPFLSYGKYADGIYLNASSKSLTPSKECVNSPNKLVLKMQGYVSSTLNTFVKNQEGALSLALVTGDKSSLNANVKNYFRRSGASHIMAVSGLHLTLTVGILLFVLRSLKIKKRTSSILAAVLTVLYMALADFSGSVTRAGIMMLVLLFGDIIGKRADTLNSLGIATAIICLNPYAVTDIGSVYSVLAVLSMVTLYPKLSGFLRVSYKDPLNKTSREIVIGCFKKLVSFSVVSACVCVYTIPVSYIFFGYVSIVSPISSFVIMPLGELCVILSQLTIYASLLHITPLTKFVGFITSNLDYALIKVCSFFSSLGGATVNLDRSFGIIICAIMLVMSAAFMFKNKKVVRLAGFLSVIVLVVSTSLFYASSKNDGYLFITPKGACVAVCRGKTVVWGVDSMQSYYEAQKCVEKTGNGIDFLLINDNPSYSALLSNNENVNNLIANQFNDTILIDSTSNYLDVQNYYNMAVDNDFSFFYNKGEATLNINGFSASSYDKGCDVLFDKTYAYDSNGKIDLSNGTVVYTIKDENTFGVRRINEWQK